MAAIHESFKGYQPYEFTTLKVWKRERPLESLMKSFASVTLSVAASSIILKDPKHQRGNCAPQWCLLYRTNIQSQNSPNTQAGPWGARPQEMTCGEPQPVLLLQKASLTLLKRRLCKSRTLHYFLIIEFKYAHLRRYFFSPLLLAKNILFCEHHPI